MTIVLPCQQAHPACLVAMPALRASIHGVASGHAYPGSVACSFLSNPLAADMRFVARAVGHHALAVALRSRRHLVFATSGRFGTECQRDYQNGWQTTLPHSWERCDWFNGELNDTDTQVY